MTSCSKPACKLGARPIFMAELTRRLGAVPDAVAQRDGAAGEFEVLN